DPNPSGERLRSVLTAIEQDAPQFADCIVGKHPMNLLHTELLIMPVTPADRTGKWAITFCVYFD
ncbi:MAG: hypothetical protein KGK33_03795, partial [Hyphomicrobiales bacterium]|nr:hypothetical protein [Hyphomicrobiales bacterium]